MKPRPDVRASSWESLTVTNMLAGPDFSCQQSGLRDPGSGLSLSPSAWENTGSVGWGFLGPSIERSDPKPFPCLVGAA